MKTKKFNQTTDRFEEIASGYGIKDFNKDRRGRYTNASTAKFFNFYLIGKSDAKLAHNSHFVIAKIERDENGSKVVFSDNPARHSSRSVCQTEIDRLSKTFKGKTFLMYQCIRARTVDIDSVDEKPTSPSIAVAIPTVRRTYNFADNGFGELISVPKDARTQATYSFLYRNYEH